MTFDKQRWRGFADWLKTEREKSSLSQDGLGNKVGLDRQTIYRLENALSGTKRETVIKIAETLNADLETALNLAGFTSVKLFENKKPQNPSEFFAILDEMGLDIQLDGGYRTLENLDADDLQELLDSVVANAVAKSKRKSRLGK